MLLQEKDKNKGAWTESKKKEKIGQVNTNKKDSLLYKDNTRQIFKLKKEH